MKLDNAEITLFKNLIRQRCGISFDETREPTLLEGIRARMSDTSLSNPSEYLGLVADNHDEFSRLVNMVTINETYFFREPAHMKILSERLIPELMSLKKAGDKIRILSAGCSTGEEPYSLAMNLIERYGTGVKNLFDIIGFDIDGDALKKAGQGVFSPHSFRGLPETLRTKYFEKNKDNGYKLKDFVRDAVNFQKLNLLSDNYPAALSGADVIFYRNVSIYFEPKDREEIFKKLSVLLNKNGYIFLSSTETYCHNIGVLSLVEIDGAFLFNKPIVAEKTSKPQIASGHPKEREIKPSGIVSHQASREIRSAVKTQWPIASAVCREKKETSSSFEDILSLARLKKYNEALLKLDELISREPRSTKACMLKAGILTCLGRLDDAKAECRKSIEMDRWSLEGHLLLGIIAKMSNDMENAVIKFKEAIYIQPSNWLAHFYLADIHKAIGDNRIAKREYGIVVKLLNEGNVKDHGLTFFPLAFPAEQVVHLCNRNLSELNRSI